ncbi:hypothetical protein QLL95_gp0248 [Cotonvirus japonicus]|uniref:Uncharacterized protein n=1 Tax=Cotonvirus japonicus TaxID=2811091 RepID=A0ABM7NRM2_9VIRU|nr:hypothetical protein QLL95_gp0248 [Cotonvirus japonicus]BCS82737.1 hypothetical protein [Cotonvirus japonicus]
MDFSIITDNDSDFDKSFEEFKEYIEELKEDYYCGGKKYFFSDKKILMMLKNDPNVIKMNISLANYVILGLKGKILDLKKLKNDTEIQLVKLVLDPTRSSSDTDILKNLMDSVEKYNSEINKYKNDSLEIHDFKKFLKNFQKKN